MWFVPANQRLDECRRRVQNETLGHRDRKGEPLYGIRRLLTMAAQRLDERGESKLVDRLAAGDPHGEVQWAWEAKEAVRDLYRIGDHTEAVEVVDELAEIMNNDMFPPEVNKLGRTLSLDGEPRSRTGTITAYQTDPPKEPTTSSS